MEWWNESIMGGSLPVTIEGDLVVDVCKIRYDDWLDQPTTNFCDVFNHTLPEMVSHIERTYAGDDKNVAYQVLGVLLMKAGSEINTVLRTSIVCAAKHDEWMNGWIENVPRSKLRKKHIDNFIVAVATYDEKRPKELTADGFYWPSVYNLTDNVL